MKVTIKNKEYNLRFRMTCWELFQQAVLDAKESGIRFGQVKSYASLIKAAIANYDERFHTEQIISDDDLEDWIDEIGVTQEGNELLMGIESEFQKTMQYQAFLDLGQKKTMSQETP